MNTHDSNRIAEGAAKGSRTMHQMLTTMGAAAATITLFSGLALGSDPFEAFDIKTTFGGGQPVYGTSLAGQLTDDLDPDLVVCRPGTPPVLYSAPELYAAQVQYPAAAATQDIALLPGDNGRYDLLTVGPNGLTAWSRDREATGEGFESRQLAGPAAWADVTLLRAAPIFGGSTWDIVGYNPTLGQIVVLRDPEQANEAQFTTPAPTTLDIVPFVRNDAGEVQLALVFPGGIIVYAFKPSFNTWMPDSSMGGASRAVCALPGSGAAQRLAWATAGASEDELTIVDNVDGFLFPGAAVGLGDIGANALTPADLDNDGVDDLAIGNAGVSSLKVLYAQSDGSFDPTVPGTYVVVELVEETSTPGNTATPVAHDFDLDGDIDLAYASASNDTVYIARNQEVDAALTQPVRTALICHWDPAGVVPTQLQMSFSNAGRPAGASHVEVVVWRQPDAASPMDPTGTRYLANASAGPSDIWVELDETGYPDFDALYAYTVRYVEADRQDPDLPTLSVFPAMTQVFVSNAETADYLESQYVFVASEVTPIQPQSPSEPADESEDTDVDPIPLGDDPTGGGTGGGVGGGVGGGSGGGGGD